MSQVKVQGNASGTGVLTVTSPNTNSNYTLTLPANTGTLVSTASAGTVLQVVSTAKTDTFSSSATAYTDITGFSVSITPTSTSSKILIIVSLSAICGDTNNMFLRFVRNSTAIDVGDAAGSRTQATTGQRLPTVDNGSIASISMSYLDSPATTSATTYKVQMGLQGGTGYVNRSPDDSDTVGRGRYASNITVMEIAA